MLRRVLLAFQSVPAVLQQRKVTLEEWKDLLRVVLDNQVRDWIASSIPRELLRWIGYPGSPTAMPPPGQATAKRGQKGWPSAANITGQRSRLVRFLAYAFGLDPEQPRGQSTIDEIIREIWSALVSQPASLLSVGETGVRTLDLPKQARVAEVRRAWLCPTTRRLLPVTFRGITPYLPECPTPELTQCREVALPRLTEPFWNGDPKTAEHWLEQDEQVRELRALGAWTDMSDRIVGFSDYFRAVEHSAQIDSARLTRREGDFKSGKINLLSCSTTMEMGVAIGGLSAVAMNDVPPHPANFLQRAGRAGRRGESAALSFTLCKSTPQGEAVFANPLWPFETALAVPSVALQSSRIVQRHVNALALTAYLFEQTGAGPFRLTCGWFFEPAAGDWSRDPKAVDVLDPKLERLTRGSILAGIAPEALLAESRPTMEQVARGWHDELDALLNNLKVVKTRGSSSRPERAIDIQLKHARKEYLLGNLATRGVLPG